MKYHEESTNVSIVSVSRFAAAPHVGHVVRTKSSPSTAMTCLMGNPYFFANAKSRSSCAGTPITAPSP